MRALPTFAVCVWCLSWLRPAGAVEAPVSVEQTALSLFDALQRGDLEAAEAMALGHAQWMSLSRRGLDADRHRARHRDFLERLAAEFRRGGQLVDLRLKDVLILPAGIKIRRAVVMAVFHLALRPSSGRGDKPVVVPVLFVQTGGEWKLFVRR